MGSAISQQLIRKGGKCMTILILGIDLAKNVLALHGLNHAGKAKPAWGASPSAVTTTCATC